MATKTIQFYSNADGSTAALVYDDVAMTASGVLVHVPMGASTVNVTAVVSGQPVDLVYPEGADTTFSFASPLPVVASINARGQSFIDVSAWLGSVGVSIMG